MKNLALYLTLKRNYENPIERRIFTEIDYALQLDKANKFVFSDIIDDVILYLSKLTTITEANLAEMERMMAKIGEVAKKQTCLCVAHAHLDVNWLWGYDETVAITLSTFDTMLKLLDTYPTFTFSQSTGFVFELVEKYRPEMLARIKKYVKEGRFELTGATFVEADKNSPSASSLLRHTEYTKQYLSKLFDIPEKEFVIDFEPDTFGHTLYEPEILATNGIKYLYHCRGNNMPPIYRWFAPSGKSVLVYREPFWYNAAVQFGDFEFVPDFCSRYGTNTTLRVYGVGDHGGGTTIRDVERITEIASYPIMANIRFGRYREFFDYLATLSNIPEVHGEQNEIFSGCYSSISEIKQANAEAEKALYEQELLCATDNSREYDNHNAVEQILVNHFHDVITGSGIEATKSYALGRYQESRGEMGAYKDEALRNFEKRINTLPLYKEIPTTKDDTSFGAGVGYGAKNVNFVNYISYGKERAYCIFNQLNYKRETVITLPLWDYYGDVTALKVFDSDGNPLPFVLSSKNSNFYWTHNYHEITIHITLDAFEYRSIVLREEKNEKIKTITYPPMYERTDDIYEDEVLENDLIKAVFDRRTFALISLIDKSTKENLIKKPSGFRLVTEDITKQMTAWCVGRFKDVKDLNSNVKFLSSRRTEIYQCLSYEIKFGASVMVVSASVNKGEKGIRFHVDTDFRELGSSVDGIPDLRFALNLGEFSKMISDADPGIIQREAADKDIPAFSFTEANGLALISDGKHGYRGYKGELSLCLLRATCDPHPFSEFGKHSFNFGVFLSGENDLAKLRVAYSFRYLPISISLAPHKGELENNGKIIDNIPTDTICISLRKNDITLFNPSEKVIKWKIFGKEESIDAYSIKRVVK